MTINGWLQIAIYFAVLTALVVPVGRYMAHVFEGERTVLSPALRPIEAFIYRVSGVDERREQHWIAYTVAMLLFNAAGFVLLYALLRLQHLFPLNPADMSAVPADLAFNTAVSFTTNTNWQNYGGESTLSYFSQMVGLTTQNFVSAATGIALLIALIRAFARASANTIGNFWVDLTRCTLYVLLPVAAMAALILVWQGVPQNLGAYVEATTIEGATQTLSQGPAASQIAIKQLGTNGGGFWNANGAVPYENPSPLSNFVEMLFLLLIPAALTHTFGRMVKDERQGWALYAAMSVIFLACVAVAYWAEAAGNPQFAALGLDPANMEGKEVRFGIANSSLWAVATTAASNGSVNSMHDSFTPLGGMMPIILMQLGEIIFGGVGSGLYGMLLLVIVAMFVAGLMVGRTPEYLGKKIEAKEVKMAMLAILILPLSILGFMAVATVAPFGLSSIQDPGPHGFSEIMYLYSSSTGNNGSAFAGYTGNTLWYNTSQRRPSVRSSTTSPPPTSRPCASLPCGGRPNGSTSSCSSRCRPAPFPGRGQPGNAFSCVSARTRARRALCDTPSVWPIACTRRGSLCASKRAGASSLARRSEIGSPAPCGLESLYAFSRKLAGAGTIDDVLWATAHQIAAMLKVRVVLLLPDNGSIALKAGYPPEDRLDEADLAAAKWAWQQSRPAGRDSDALPGAKWLFFPLRTGRGPIGILGICRDEPGPILRAEQRRLLDALGDQGALAIERVHLVEDIDRVRRGAERDRLRSALLTSISHDLKTPLAAVLGAAGALRDLPKALDDDAKADLLATIIDESERLNRFIANLLDMRILVVDDEPPIRKLLRMGLTSQGYEVLDAPNGKAALDLLAKKPDLVILDLGLPDIDGLELLQKMRQCREDLPIVVLSSRGDEVAKVAALDLGADDYVTKPFGMDELFARMRAALRQQLQTQGERPVFQVGDLSVDLVRRIVKLGDNEVKLSPKEYELLRLLVQHAGKVLTHRFLLQELWDEPTDTQYLRVYVRQLRRKIESDPERPRYLLTETGIGYRLRAPA